MRFLGDEEGIVLHNAYDGEDGWEGEDSRAYGLGNHDCSFFSIFSQWVRWMGERAHSCLLACTMNKRAGLRTLR